MIVWFVWDSLRGELREGGGAHSQTKLAENGKPFRRSPLFCIRFLLPCPVLVPSCRTFPPSLLWPLFSLPFLQLSPHGHHPCYTKSSVLSTAHSLVKHFFVFEVGLAQEQLQCFTGLIDIRWTFQVLVKIILRISTKECPS